MAVSLAQAQYPGRVPDNKVKKVTAPRAVSVLEWVGQAGKPSASRLVPVTVFDNGEYQDGGLYLAQPAPLAVESGTEYELQQDGVAKGEFDVFTGQNVQGSWFGYGTWKPLDKPKPPPKLEASKTLPQVIRDADPDRPHFKTDGDAKTAPAPADKGQSAPGQSAPAPAPADDPDRPTLHRRTGDDSGGGGSSGSETPPAEDPDRPHLKRHSKNEATQTADGSPVSSVNEPDPDRPRLSRGKPAQTAKELEATKLTGTPPDLQQMIAVSDETSREEHSFAYQWANPDDAAKAQAAMEAIARGALAAPEKPSFGGTKTGVHPTHPAAHRGAAAKAQAPPIPLTGEQFKAYELSYGGGATLVLTAKSGEGAGEKYVTVIARPDFYGVPQVLFKSVTDADHLDITPRMRLVDAVDTNGDNRAELVFELRGKTDRQFAVYRVATNGVEQAFATGALPYGTASHVEQ